MIRHLVATVLLAAVAVADWFAWLGWDQKRVEHPDGHTTGPYEAWQVVGLVVVLMLVGGVAAYRRYGLATTFGFTVGLTAAVSYDWSADDGSGLWVVGAGMVAVSTLVATGLAAAMISAITRRPPARGTGI
ncbi:hypothetical protein ACSNOI_36350 [Actinomadura kijaniata]|uniref:hypothetical protein n=1 Tax=Actinomadura kijaniata TaxID=46161 RepID=UPI003F1B2D38